MLRRMCIKRIVLATFILLVLSLIYIIPSNDRDLQMETTINYINLRGNPREIYLLDQNQMIARTTIALNTENREVEDQAKELLEALIIGGKNQRLVPNGFRPIIPVDTKILSVKFEGDTLKINFSKEFLEVKAEHEEKMIEAICFTLTTIKEVNGIIIYIEDKIMTELPHSKRFLPGILGREFGINKVFNITRTSGVQGVTIYYINRHNDMFYYVPVTKFVNDSREKVKIIIEELSSSFSYQRNLMSFLNSNARLLHYEILDRQMTLEFNNYLINDMDRMDIMEEVKYTISLSMRANYDIDEVVFWVNKTEIAVMGLN